jgi:hypothetical protein
MEKNMSRTLFAPICSCLLAFALGGPSLGCSTDVIEERNVSEGQGDIAEERDDITQEKTDPPVEIELSRRASSGFCYAAGQFGRMLLTRDAQGRVTMTGTVLEEALPDDPACVTTYTGQTSCLANRPMEAQQLTDEDVTTLDALIAALPPDQCVVKELLACDDCKVGTITVDGVGHEKTCCGTQHSEGYDDAFLALEGFVDGLLP